MGDLNGRLADKEDFIIGVDEIPPRIHLDTTINDHGRALHNFLIQTKTCVLNGRICPLDDNFTSILHRGKAVVDYMITPHQHLKHFTSFAVKTISNLVTELGIVDGGYTRISDHSLLQACVKVGTDCELNVLEKEVQPLVEKPSTTSDKGRSETGKRYSHPPKKYKKSVLPEKFMTGEHVLSECTQLIDSIVQSRGVQQEVDDIYEELVRVYHEEVSNFLKVAKVAPKSRKMLRHVKKPYWNDMLSELWHEFHVAELRFVKMDRKDEEYQEAKTDFLSKQKTFDKVNKKCRRFHQRSQMYALEEANTNDPTAFWHYINNLGPKKTSGIPWEVWGEDGEVVTDHEQVLNKWKNEFESLLTPPSTDSEEQVNFKRQINEGIEKSENAWTEADHHPSLNRDFDIEEVRKIVMKTKSGKAPGLDGLMSDVYKNDLSIKVLTHLFNLCLRKHVIPTMWSSGMINPIPKSATAGSSKS